MNLTYERQRLSEPFHYPQMADLNARSGLWQERKRKWNQVAALQSHNGRAEDLTYAMPRYMPDGRPLPQFKSQTSVFDPVLAELCYQWWCPAGGNIIDPFAGGSVRGIVASMKGHNYWGCDLRREQVNANYAQLTADNTGAQRPHWVCGDAYDMLRNAPRADLVFSCPPYGDLERYSDDPRDLSAMPSYRDFLKRYRKIIAKACKRLRDDRFAVFVVADFRDRAKRGRLHDFVGDTTRAFEDAGLALFTKATHLLPIGSGAMRAAALRNRGSAALVNTQNTVLVFAKGDAGNCLGGLDLTEGASLSGDLRADSTAVTGKPKVAAEVGCVPVLMISGGGARTP